VDLQGRSALVTGGAGGLGAATVRRLVELGVGVAIFDRDEGRASPLAAELGKNAGQCPVTSRTTTTSPPRSNRLAPRHLRWW
jgi:NAD(P)-dependent dehydrogenase (short-subunit alcohol dehydrogenase family)